MIPRKKRTPQRIDFNKKHPLEYALLNCLRKALFTDDKFVLYLSPKFSINEKEYQIWGHITHEQRIAVVEKTKNKRYRCQLNDFTIVTISKALEKIQLGEIDG